MLDLNLLVATGSAADLQLTEGITINDRGEIIGNGLTSDGNNHQFLMIPCDEAHPHIRGCDYSRVDDSMAHQASALSRTPRSFARSQSGLSQSRSATFGRRIPGIR